MKTVKLLLIVIAVLFIFLLVQMAGAQNHILVKSLRGQRQKYTPHASLQSTQRTENTSVLDSTYFFSWDTVSMKWLNGAVGFTHVGMPYLETVTYDTIPGDGIGKGVYYYGTNNNVTGDIFYYVDHNTWQKSIKDSNTYDANNNWLTCVQKTWSSNSWHNHSKGIQTFNANNKVTNAIAQSWNGATFENNIQDIYGYDANNNDTSDLYQGWDGSAWGNLTYNSYTYDVNHNQTTSLLLYWGTTSYFTVQLDKYTYNIANKMTFDTTITWDTTHLVWDTLYRTAITYDTHNNDTCDLYQQWKRSAWASYARVLHNYDVNNNQTLGLSQVWDTVNLVWVNSAEFIYTYDANNNELTEVDQFKWSGNKWVNNSHSDSTRNYYGLPQSVNNILQTSTETFTVAPNPNNGEFTLKANLSAKDNYSIEVTNVLGQSVYTENINDFSGMYTKQIDMKMYGKGLYLVSIKTQTSQMVKKVIVY